MATVERLDVGKPKTEEVKPKPQPTKTQTFKVQVMIEKGPQLEAIQGKPLTLKGDIQAFVHRPPTPEGKKGEGWAVSDPETGREIARSYRGTQEDAVKLANDKLAEVASRQNTTPQELMKSTIARVKAQNPDLYGEAPKAEVKVEPPKPTDTRTEHAIAADKAVRAEEGVMPTNKEGVEKWKEHPEQIDVQGVDTPAPKQAKARKPRAKITEHKEPTTYVIEDTRSPHAVACDRARQALTVYDRRNKGGVSKWREHPNQMDIRGIDTLKTRAPRFKGGRVVIDKKGHKHRQKRGSII